MRATITRYIEALKKRRASDEGFSLIELIVVVAILGILVAIAIPVFSNIQESARQNSLATAAASGATVAAAQIASNKDAADIQAALDSSAKTGEYSLAIGADITLDGFCVTATADAAGSLSGATAETSGPGC